MYNKTDKEVQTLLKYLTCCGIAGRRKLLSTILDGKISVNGKIIRESGYIVAANDVVHYEGLKTDKKKLIYFAFNKPVRVVTTLHDDRGRKTVADFFAGMSRLVPVGRLDYMSSGLLIMTNDGNLMHKLMHPRYEVQKEYDILIDKILPNDIIGLLGRGIEIDGRKTAPCRVVVKNCIKNEGVGSMLISMTLHEGRNREIRKMMEHVHANVISLKRIRYKNIFLNNLPFGSYRELTKREVDGLRENLF